MNTYVLTIKKILHIFSFSIIFLICFIISAPSAYAGYSSVGIITSTNLLAGNSVSSITNFHYTLISLPGDSSVSVQFSTDGSTWYSASGVLNGSTNLSTTGGADVSLTALNWSGNSFYYKITLNPTSDLTNTPTISEVYIDYTASTGYNDAFFVDNSGNVNLGIVDSKFSTRGGATFGVDYFAVTPPTNGVLVQGNVGIGVSDPVARLALKGDGTNPVFNMFDGSGSNIFTLLNTGNVGIGTTTPQTNLHVVRSDDGAPVRFEDSSGYCEINPTSTTWTCTSDLRLKDNIVSLNNEEILIKINELNPVTFSWKTDDANGERLGLIAQEVEGIFPNLVNSDKDTGLKSVSYGGFTTYLISAVQELLTRVQTIEERLANSSGNILSNIGSVFSKLTVGSSEKPSGITLYDEATGEPYCLLVRNGDMVTRNGACDDPNSGDTSSTYSTGESSNSSSEEVQTNEETEIVEDITEGEDIIDESTPVDEEVIVDDVAEQTNDEEVTGEVIVEEVVEDSIDEPTEEIVEKIEEGSESAIQETPSV